MEAIARLEREGADNLGITLFELMQRAGEAAFSLLRQQWPHAQHWVILCGPGNNGGDGFVVARLAQAAGVEVALIAVESDSALPEEARQARENWLAAGGVIHDVSFAWPEKTDVIVDACWVPVSIALLLFPVTVLLSRQTTILRRFSLWIFLPG